MATTNLASKLHDGTYEIVKWDKPAPNGDCQVLIRGEGFYGWCRYSNKLSSILVDGIWWVY